MTAEQDEETKDRRHREPMPAPTLISARLLAAIMITVLVLIVLVVLVGLARDNLDTSGVATVLSTLFSGIVVGALIKGRDDKGGTP